MLARPAREAGCRACLVEKTNTCGGGYIATQQNTSQPGFFGLGSHKEKVPPFKKYKNAPAGSAKCERQPCDSQKPEFVKNLVRRRGVSMCSAPPKDCPLPAHVSCRLSWTAKADIHLLIIKTWRLF